MIPTLRSLALLIMLASAAAEAQIGAADTPDAAGVDAKGAAADTKAAGDADTPPASRGSREPDSTRAPQGGARAARADARAARADARAARADAAASRGGAQPSEGGVKTLAGMSILGNQEAPKSLVIVPWKSSELGDGIGVSRALDTTIRPVDKDVFMRELKYYEIRESGSE